MTNATALIAEDEPLLASGLRADLARLWPQLQVVATVGDGAQAVEQALRLRPDICFLDIRMPALSGLQAAQALAEDWPADHPFPLLVFVTAYDQYAVQAFEAQAVDYLVKPVQSARLDASLQRLRERLASRRAGPAPAEALDATWAQLRALLASAEPAARAPRRRIAAAERARQRPGTGCRARHPRHRLRPDPGARAPGHAVRRGRRAVDRRRRRRWHRSFSAPASHPS